MWLNQVIFESNNSNLYKYLIYKLKSCIKKRVVKGTFVNRELLVFYLWIVKSPFYFLLNVSFDNNYLWNENPVFDSPWTVIFLHVFYSFSREMITSTVQLNCWVHITFLKRHSQPRVFNTWPQQPRECVWDNQHSRNKKKVTRFYGVELFWWVFFIADGNKKFLIHEEKSHFRLSFTARKHFDAFKTAVLVFV